MSRMRNMLDYARSRLERFDERGFCTVDSLILSWVAYTRLPAGDSDLAPARGWEGVRLADLHRAEHFDAYYAGMWSEEAGLALPSPPWPPAPGSGTCGSWVTRISPTPGPRSSSRP